VRRGSNIVDNLVVKGCEGLSNGCIDFLVLEKAGYAWLLGCVNALSG